MKLVETIVERHCGEPLRPFVELYRRLGSDAADGASRLVKVVATGAYSDRLGPPVLAGVPEEIAQEHAARALFGDEGALNIVRIGGSGYSVLTRTAAGRVRYEPNERCSAGTGETIEGLCTRLGSSLARAVELAQASPDAIVVTSRCAVFAKSELTHYANEGEDHGRIFRGVFESVARNVHALYDKVKVDGPVVVVGNGALIGPVVEAFSRLAGVSVIVPPEAGYFEALGALRYGAADLAPRDTAESPPVWPADPESLVRRSPRRIRALTPAAEGGGSVVWLDNGAAARVEGEPDPCRPRTRPRVDRLQGRLPRPSHGRAAGRRVPAHRGQPRGGGEGPRRGAARALPRRCGCDRRHGLGPRRRRDRPPCRLPRPGRASHGPQ